jgi:Flp pilus assembly pilin Flp
MKINLCYNKYIIEVVYVLNQKGQALVEYVLIVAIISVITISIVSYFGGYLKDSITKTSCSLVDQEYEEGEKPGEGKCVDKKEKSDLWK